MSKSICVFDETPHCPPHGLSYEQHIIMQYKNTYRYAYIGVGKAEQMQLGKYVYVHNDSGQVIVCDEEILVRWKPF